MLKTPRERNLVILGVVFILLVLGYEYAYTPLVERYGQLGEEIQASQLRLSKSRAKIEQKPVLEAKIRQLNDRLANFDQLLLPGQKPSLAAAALQKIVKTMVTARNRATLTSEKIQQPIEVGRYTRIPIQVSIRCLVSDLKEIFYQIENYKLMLDVTQISIRVVTPQQPSDIEANIVVEGIILASPEV